MTDQNPADDIQNRVVRVVVPYERVEPLFTGEVVAADRLPDDATLARVFEQADRREFNFVFRHESFDAVDVGEQIPSIRPEYRRLTQSEWDVFEESRE